jgi:hypothetical protein
MAIIQISKIQQRSGNIVDLPQLDEAEFGFATDVKKLYIGKESPTENIEILTSYSNISFGQIEGACHSNLNVDCANLANGQVLTFTGTEWTNRGGNLGGLITLGNVANVKITGGQQNYSLTTDGTGNLSWAPTSAIVATIQNVTKSNPAIVTTADNNYFTSGAQITITNVTGMTQLNGNTYYANVLTSNTLSLYYDRFLSSPVNSTSYGTFPYTTATATTAGTNYITVANSVPFTINAPVVFTGNTFGNITANVTYYVQAVPSTTALVITTTTGGAPVALTTASGSCGVYVTGGRIISSVGGGASNGAAGGSNTTVQYNVTGQLNGNLNFTYDYLTSNLTLNGNANVGNLLVTGNAQINGDLVVNGNTTSVNIDTLNVQDPIISLGRGPNDSPLTSNDGKDRGEQLWYYTSSEKSAFIGYQNSTGNLIAATDVTIASEIVTVNSYGNFVFGNIFAINITASGDVAVNGGDLTSTSSTINVFPTSATANFAASGTTVNIGASTGITNVKNNLNVTASNLTVSNTTFNLANTTATTINFGGDATLINIGNTNAGSTTIKNNLNVNGNATVLGTFTTTAITSGGNTTPGTITGNWTLTAGSKLEATYADLAEYYVADFDYEPGTVLEFGGEFDVTLAEDGTQRVAGVVSTDPAYVMNSSCEGEHIVALALQGRVPTKVHGAIKKGDMLISGGNGYARSSSMPIIGTVIGKALENFNGTAGLIEVAIGRL